MPKADALCGLIVLVLGAAIAFEAQRIPDPGVDVIGPGAFPFVLGLVIAACGAALVLRSLSGRTDDAERPPPARWAVLAVALALLVAYTQSIEWLGFPLSTVLFVAACLALLGERGAVRLAGAGIAVSIVVFVVFGLLLGVNLPWGRAFAG